MKVRLLAVGTKMPGWVEEGVAAYRKRLPREFSLEIEEIALGPRGKNADIARARAQEGERIRERLRGDEQVIALEVDGRPLSTEALSKEVGEWRMQGRDIAILVGGPDGLEPALSAQAHKRWSLSALTLPHPLVRIVLAEQLYRAWTRLIGHPYHR